MRSRYAIAGMIMGTALAAASAATAQSAPEEITVIGRGGKAPDNVQSLSQVISYSDLDLSTAAGKKAIRQRISLTARWLCDKLGESDTATPPIPSCRDAAVSDAMQRLGTIEEKFAPRGTTWVAGSAWQPPYPTDWTKKYP